VVRNLVKAVFPGFGKVNKNGKGELFMETSDSKSVKRLAKSMTGVIVSLAVFACVFAVIVLHFGGSVKINGWFILLIYLLAILPLIGFLWFRSFMVFLLVAKAIDLLKATSSDTKKTLDKIQNLSEATDSDTKKTLDEIQNLSKAINSNPKKIMDKIKKILKIILDI
jgi:hypothetical protein